MRGLRALTRGLALLAALGALFAAAARAEIQTVTTGASVQSLSGAFDPGNLLGPVQAARVSQNLGYKIEDLFQALTVSGSIVNSQPDYSNYLITTKTGIAEPLSALEPATDELSGSLGLGWASGSHAATLAWAGSLSSSPFFSQSLTAGYTESFFEKTTAIGVKATDFLLAQPLTYYIDSSFHSQARPTTIHGSLVAADIDQALTERWKAGLELSTGIREEDRPRNVGVSLSQAYAIFDRVFARLELSRIAELTSEPLKDDRGYFALNSAEASATFEPWVDFLVSVSYAFVLETETTPATGAAFEVGSDQFGLGLSYRRGHWGTDLKAAYRATNIQISDFSLEGGVSWRI